jgi:hypothetical protein
MELYRNHHIASPASVEQARRNDAPDCRSTHTASFRREKGNRANHGTSLSPGRATGSPARSLSSSPPLHISYSQGRLSLEILRPVSRPLYPDYECVARRHLLGTATAPVRSDCLFLQIPLGITRSGGRTCWIYERASGTWLSPIFDHNATLFKSNRIDGTSHRRRFSLEGSDVISSLQGYCNCLRDGLGWIKGGLLENNVKVNIPN